MTKRKPNAVRGRPKSGNVPVLLRLPEPALKNIDLEAKRARKTRSQVVARKFLKPEA